MARKILLESPNKKINCHIFEIGELNKAAFGCKYYFTGPLNKVLYYKRNTYFHELSVPKTNDELSDKSDFKFLQWSAEGNWVYFIEYSTAKGHASYNSVFIDFSNRRVYVIDENEGKFERIKKLGVTENPFEENDIKKRLEEEYKIPSLDLRSDKLPFFGYP